MFSITFRRQVVRQIKASSKGSSRRLLQHLSSPSPSPSSLAPLKVICDVSSSVSCWPSAIIIHQTHYEKSDWSRAFNQFTIACELDMINAIAAADIAFIMSSSTSAWLLSPLECSPQKQNG